MEEVKICADKNVINALCSLFQRYDIQKALLFGSRARGDCKTASDYDIAVYGNLSGTDKSALRNFCREDLPTLHKIDLLFADEIFDKALIDNIEREGAVIYVAAEQ